VSTTNRIVINDEKGWIFQNEQEMLDHFKKEIEQLENEYRGYLTESDIPEKDHSQYESHLEETLNEPDEIWKDVDTIKNHELYIYLKEYEKPEEELPLFHVAIAHRSGEIPNFIYLHFPTNSIDLVERYQRGEIQYDRILANAPLGALDGDALLEADELAVGLYEAMLSLRSGKDIPEAEFRDYAKYRERSIEEADEIWRSNDTLGNVLVSFVKDWADEAGKPLYYIVVTVEDAPSNSHALLFSFPTTDTGLVERYRHGENLHADEVVQESSH
jgi:hypothetical protein